MSATDRSSRPSAYRPASVAADAFFAKLALDLPASDAASMVITHLLPGQMNFLAALGRVATVEAVLAKPKSADRRTLEEVTASYRCDPLDRERFADPEWLVPYLERRAAGRPLVLADVGGYFAPALAEACAALPGQIAGVVEDTENGLRRYLELDAFPCPVYSVARSPLKEPEDRLVGEAIVFSAETLLRRLGEVLPGRRACVLGFGKIGAGIAAALHARSVQVTVQDIDPIRQAQAVAIGYGAADLPRALGHADLVFSATGNRAIGMEHLAMLRDGAFLAGATSADDEFDLTALASPRAGFERQDLIPGVTRYARSDHAFCLLGNGNAVNFLHSSAVGPAIHVIKAEIVAAASLLAGERHQPGLYEVPATTRTRIATAWLEAFRPSATAGPALGTDRRVEMR
ncbi:MULTISPECIES: adenosylhomocysteinase [unclassified Streptomyces]|uniref:adenosylhomocysteinase n=1 Tax=unclassified Streptomyces TaxID=2593676 RepID=UPI002E2DBE2E|nr:adenosylhomocysteinase [Streptomyces sp. NBC_00223]